METTYPVPTAKNHPSPTHPPAESFPRRGSCLAALAISGALCALTLTARAQLIYSQNFEADDSANWVVLQGSAFNSQGENSLVNFNFDYSTVGIPKAPHSAAGDGTVGFKLMADINPITQLGSVTGAGLSCSPINFSISANFDMHVDMWCNYNGNNVGPGGANFTAGSTATNAYTVVTIPGSGSGSSIFYGCGYGTAGTAAQIAGTADSIYVGTCVDNGSSAEMRMYGPSQTGSYQNNVYQSTGTTSPGFSGDPFVYNNSTGTRTFANLSQAADPGWTNHFAPTQPPLAQQMLYRQQTNIACFAGLIDFAWHDVEVQKIGSIIVYSIDGRIAATGNAASAGNPAGSYLTFLAFDINGNASLDPNYTNLNFVLFDNIRVSNYDNIVSVQATQPTALETGPTAGTFTITRTSAGVPLTINYTLTGSAVNGSQYNVGAGASTTSVTFGANDSTTNITITPIDDGVPNLPTTVILTIQPGTGYTGAGSDIVNILDGDTPTVDITASQGTMYERYASNPDPYQDFITYKLTRRGRTTASSTVGLTVTSANAVAGTDYSSTNNIFIDVGLNTTNFQIFPVRNPAVTGNKTITVTVSSVSGGGAVGNAVSNSATIVDSDYAPATVILNDPLSDPADAPNWVITYGTGDLVNHAADFNVDFGYTLGIPAPPGGSSTALHITCNKANGLTGANVGAPGAVNVYYTNLPALSNNYAVRFNMNLVEGSVALNAFEHEGAIFGINHSGTQSNWWYAGGTDTSGTFGSDGVWYYVGDEYGGTLQGDYQGFVGAGPTGWTRVSSDIAPHYTSVFKTAPLNGNYPGPFTSLDDTLHQTGGVPAEGPAAFLYDESTWSDVEIKQINNIVTLSINRTTIFNYTNTTAYTSGCLMLGYSDPYGDGEDSASSVYYANLTVVQLVAPVITNTVVGGGNVTVTFTAGSGDAPSSFTLQSSSNVNGPFADVSPAATITAVGGAFQAVVPWNNTAPSQKFYRVARN